MSIWEEKIISFYTNNERDSATMWNHMLDMRAVAAAGSRAEIPLPARTSPSALCPHPHSRTRCKPDCDPTIEHYKCVYIVYTRVISVDIIITIVILTISSACDITTHPNHPSHHHHHRHTASRSHHDIYSDCDPRYNIIVSWDDRKLNIVFVFP